MLWNAAPLLGTNTHTRSTPLLGSRLLVRDSHHFLSKLSRTSGKRLHLSLAGLPDASASTASPQEKMHSTSVHKMLLSSPFLESAEEKVLLTGENSEPGAWYLVQIHKLLLSFIGDGSPIFQKEKVNRYATWWEHSVDSGANARAG